MADQKNETTVVLNSPKESDRKIFLNCLAVVLSSRYNYDSQLATANDDEIEAFFQNLHIKEEQLFEGQYHQESLDNVQSIIQGQEQEQEQGRVEKNYVRDDSFASSTWNSSSERTSELMKDQDDDALTADTMATDSSTHSVMTETNDPTKSGGHLLSRREFQKLRTKIQRHRNRRNHVLTTALQNASQYLRLGQKDAKIAQALLKKTKNTMTNKPDENNKEKTTHAALEPYLSSLSSPAAGFQCLSLLLLEHLLHNKEGYDARIRYAYKTLGVVVMMAHQPETKAVQKVQTKSDGSHNATPIDCAPTAETVATRQFENLEHAIARTIVLLSIDGTHKLQQQSEEDEDQSRRHKKKKNRIVHGLTIGAVGAAAGTLIAITGGLAAPALAASMVALVGSTTTVVLLTSTTAVTTIFGVSGGGLAAYKMHRRQIGLTELDFQKEVRQAGKQKQEEGDVEAELFMTVCISGWLRDKCDFQRPWGVTPTNPPIKSELEKLQRFCAVHKKDSVENCAEILEEWKDKEGELWSAIKKEFGTDPDHLFPLKDNIRQQTALTEEQQRTIKDLLIKLKYTIPLGDESARKQKLKMFKSMRTGLSKEKYHPKMEKEDEEKDEVDNHNDDDKDIKDQDKLPHDGISVLEPREKATLKSPDSNTSISETSLTGETSSEKKDLASTAASPSASGGKSKVAGKTIQMTGMPEHIRTAWDYQSTYGGELYTLRFESAMLMELYRSVQTAIQRAATSATQEALKWTILASVVTAVAIPVALIKAENMIDGIWTIACARADEAGSELAKCLLYSQSGKRPVSLIGFSMGARVIYFCLKELVKLQEKWEEMQEMKAKGIEVSYDKKSPYEGMDKMREPASIVEDVIFMGLPNHLTFRSWYAIRQVVAGRLVNCYSRKDLILTLMFRMKKVKLKSICGTCAVDVPGVENVDVSDLILSHTDYCYKVGDILQRVRNGEPTRGPDNMVANVDVEPEKVVEELMSKEFGTLNE